MGGGRRKVGTESPPPVTITEGVFCVHFVWQISRILHNKGINENYKSDTVFFNRVQMAVVMYDSGQLCPVFRTYKDFTLSYSSHC